MNVDEYRYCVIGPGRLGTALLAGLAEAGLTVAACGVHNDEDADGDATPPRLSIADVAAAADVWWLAVPDDEIRSVASRLSAHLPAARRADESVAIHCSGLGSVQLLEPLATRGVRVLCLHPLQTFTGERGGALLRSVPCAVTALDERNLRLGEQLATRLSMRPFRLADEKKNLYHLAAALSCNLLVALESEAKRLMDEATGGEDGLELLAPLLQTTLTNLLGAAGRRTAPPGAGRGAGPGGRAGDPAHVLTGPVARGDVGTVRTHLRLLEGRAPRLEQAYRALSLEALTLAAPRLDDEQVRALKHLLGGGAA